MHNRSKLIRSIVAATGGHFILQAAYFLIVAAVAGIPGRWVLAFVATSATVHAGFTVFLSLRTDDFVTVPRNERLEHINLANVLTMFRISSVPTILYLTFLSGLYPTVGWLIALTSASFVSDFVDGRVSRARGEITRVGRYLDSSSDYTILAAVAISFHHFGLVSTWFFWLLLFRLAFQVAGMVGLMIYQGGHVEPRTSFLGKASVFAAMVVFALSLLSLIENIRAIGEAVTITAEIFASAIIAVSVGDKAILLYKDFRDAKQSRRA